MSNEEIIENNKLIAEFMNDTIALNWVAQGIGLDYHSSWDWLMPVVAKIKEDLIKTHGKRGVQFKIEVYSIMVEIDKAYESVVEYIKYHNQTTTPKP